MINQHKISLAEACEFLECEQPRLMELLREGVIPGFKPGKAWVVPRAAFFQAVNDEAVAAAFRLRSEKTPIRGG